jgi:hypothetical protein
VNLPRARNVEFIEKQGDSDKKAKKLRALVYTSRYRGRGQDARYVCSHLGPTRPGFHIVFPQIFDGMEYWIPDSPFTLLQTKRSKSKKEQPGSIPVVQPTADGLILSSGGALSSAILKRSEVPGSIVDWDFIQQPSLIVPHGECAQILTFSTYPGNTRIKATNTTYTLFPATRPATLALPALNLRQRTEQAVCPLSTAKRISILMRSTTGSFSPDSLSGSRCSVRATQGTTSGR